MRVFLDDLRDPPIFDQMTGERLQWDAVVRTAEEAIALVAAGKVTFLSFDHDLGSALSGYDVAKKAEELAHSGAIPPIDYAIHSGNPVGAENIDRAMKAAWRFWKKS